MFAAPVHAIRESLTDLPDCMECGHPVVEDPNGSEGVFVHDRSEDPDLAYDLDEDHAPVLGYADL